MFLDLMAMLLMQTQDTLCLPAAGHIAGSCSACYPLGLPVLLQQSHPQPVKPQHKPLSAINAFQEKALTFTKPDAILVGPIFQPVNVFTVVLPYLLFPV